MNIVSKMMENGDVLNFNSKLSPGETWNNDWNFAVMNIVGENK